MLLEEAPHAIPQGKKYRVEIEDIKAPGTDPTISAKVLWLEKRSGVELTGQVSGVATHSVRGALLNLKDKVDDMVKAQK